LPDQEQWDPRNQQRPPTLSRERFAALYGATDGDLEAVADFARSNGLAVIGRNTSARTVTISGPSARVGRAFGVELGRYESSEETYRGREGYIYVPEALAELVEGVFGLDNRRMAWRANNPAGTSPLTPPQVANLYNFPTWNAVSQTIGIVEFSGPGPSIPTCGFSLADVQLFMASLGPGFQVPTITTVNVDGAPNAFAGSAQNIAPNDPDIEVALDIQVAGSVAQGADMAVYFTPGTEQGWIDAINTAVFDTSNSPSALSISWGAPESAWSTSAINNLSITFQEAALIGVTVFASSGDQGTDCGVNDGRAHVLYPASDPWITACGGTYTANVAGSAFTQGTWSDSTGATGGGVSEVLPLPVWQAGAGVPVSVNPSHHQGRGVPDIAGNASPLSGYVLYVYGQQTTALTLTTGPQAGSPLGVIAGTSAVAPLYAALVALINADSGLSIGYLNPTLYAIAEDPAQSVFTDIADGARNSVPISPPNPPGSVSPGYTSGPGWDACTGWGVIDGNALVAALLQAEGATMIDPDNPFSFSQWREYEGDQGANGDDDEIQAGDANSADDNHTTWINTTCPNNATWFVENMDDSQIRQGAVGVFGRSHGAKGSIGVAGESETGCGVYGISTHNKTIGVAGRSMGGEAVEDLPLEDVVRDAVGVLGHSNFGPGVRGHGGPLLTVPQETAVKPVAAEPGGVFSSGQLTDVIPAELGELQIASNDPLPQLRLIPALNGNLPATGQWGDLYVNITGDPTDPGGTLTVNMYLCVVPGNTVPGNAAWWAPFSLGPAQQAQ
jgi:kumamolisin